MLAIFGDLSQSEKLSEIEPLPINTHIFFSSLLEKDFEELMQRYFYDYIELQLDFAMDLYPFFPPLVKVILIFFKKRRKSMYML